VKVARVILLLAIVSLAVASARWIVSLRQSPKSKPSRKEALRFCSVRYQITTIQPRDEATLKA